MFKRFAEWLIESDTPMNVMVGIAVVMMVVFLAATVGRL